MANLAFRSAASDGDSSFSSTTDIATVPSGAAQNDLEQIWYSSAAIAPAAAPTHTTPSGWTAAGTTVANGVASGALNVRLTLYYRIAPSTPANATLTSSAAAAHAWTRLAHDNPDTAAPFGQVAFGTFTGTSVVASTITTTKANALLGMYVAQGAAQALAPASGLTERSDNATQGIEFADVIQAAAGATGTKTATAPSSTDGVWGFAEFWSEVAGAVLAATPAAVTTATAALSTQIRATAAASVQATAAAALTTAIQPAAAAQAQVTAAASLSTCKPLAASAGGQCSATASLTTAIPLAANASSTSTITAAFASGAAALTASASTSTSCSASLSTQVRLAAAGQGATTTGAALSTSIRLAGAAAGQCSATAALSTGIRLAAAAQASCSVSATFSGTAAALVAAAAGRAAATADLSTAIVLAGAAVARAQVSAALATGIALAAAVHGDTTASAELAINLQDLPAYWTYTAPIDGMAYQASPDSLDIEARADDFNIRSLT